MAGSQQEGSLIARLVGLLAVCCKYPIKGNLMQTTALTATGPVLPVVPRDLRGCHFSAATAAVLTIGKSGAASTVAIKLEVPANTTEEVSFPSPVPCDNIYFTLVSGTGTLVVYHD